MAKVNINNSVSICLETEEKETLLKSYKILDQLRNEIYIRDDDSAMFWSVDGIIEGLENIFDAAGIRMEGV